MTSKKCVGPSSGCSTPRKSLISDKSNKTASNGSTNLKSNRQSSRNISNLQQETIKENRKTISDTGNSLSNDKSLKNKKTRRSRSIESDHQTILNENETDLTLVDEDLLDQMSDTTESNETEKSNEDHLEQLTISSPPSVKTAKKKEIKTRAEKRSADQFEPEVEPLIKKTRTTGKETSESARMDTSKPNFSSKCKSQNLVKVSHDKTKEDLIPASPEKSSSPIKMEHNSVLDVDQRTLHTLRSLYANNCKPKKNQLEAMALRTGMPVRLIQNWFEQMQSQDRTLQLSPVMTSGAACWPLLANNESSNLLANHQVHQSNLSRLITEANLNASLSANQSRRLGSMNALSALDPSLLPHLLGSSLLNSCLPNGTVPEQSATLTYLQQCSGNSIGSLLGFGQTMDQLNPSLFANRSANLTSNLLRSANVNVFPSLESEQSSKLLPSAMASSLNKDSLLTSVEHATSPSSLLKRFAENGGRCLSSSTQNKHRAMLSPSKPTSNELPVASVQTSKNSTSFECAEKLWTSDVTSDLTLEEQPLDLSCKARVKDQPPRPNNSSLINERRQTTAEELQSLMLNEMLNNQKQNQQNLLPHSQHLIQSLKKIMTATVPIDSQSKPNCHNASLCSPDSAQSVDTSLYNSPTNVMESAQKKKKLTKHKEETLGDQNKIESVVDKNSNESEEDKDDDEDLTECWKEPFSESNGDVYACDHCDKTFTKQNSLSRHKYEHTGKFDFS